MQFPTPAVNIVATNFVQGEMPLTSSSKYRIDDDCNMQESVVSQSKPGALPLSATELTKAARALLLRLLDPDHKVRLRNLRQLQQTAFYMGFNFEHVKMKKVSPRSILEKHCYDLSKREENFIEFDQPIVL